jgi:hypothetical protein
VPTALGANSVASVLGNYARRDPGAASRQYHGRLQSSRKTGTFYFARNRNFLFCLDRTTDWPPLLCASSNTPSSAPPGVFVERP